MKLKKLVSTAVLMGLLSMGGNALAFSFVQPYVGPVKFKYSNFETLITQTGQELYGIFQVSTINADNPANTLLWFSGKDGEELTGTFSSYIAQNITSFTGGQAIDFTGGIVNVYLGSPVNFNANPFPTGTGVTDGILFLSFKGKSGFVSDDPSTPWDESQDTLRSTVDQLTSPFTGKGYGMLEITGGAYASMFGGIGAIMTLNSDIAAPDPQKSQWPVGSEDPIRGNVVPEPGTFVLLGLGLAGLGIYGRKRMTGK